MAEIKLKVKAKVKRVFGEHWCMAPAQPVTQKRLD
jgi:hypothetical protein